LRCRRGRHLVAISLLAIHVAITPRVVCATTLPVAKGSTYLLPAGEHDLRQALINFGKANGLSVNVSPDITGTVSGNGQLQPSVDFVSSIAARNGLSWFTFRDTVYFARTQDSIEASITVKAAQQASLRSALVAMKLLDDKFTWTELPAQDQILLFGPRSYIQLVRQQAARLQAAPVQTIAKPVEAATEAMIFKLKYASATDKEVSANGTMTLRPGVASLLKSLYGQDDRAIGIPRRTSAMPSAGQTTQRPALYNVSPTPGTASPTPVRPTVPAIAAIRNSDANRMESTATSGAIPMWMGDRVWDAQGAAFDNEAHAGLPAYHSLARTEAPPMIEADQRTNSILIRDRPSRRPEYERLIASLDVAIQQLELETILVEMPEEDIAKSLGKLPSRTADGDGRQGLIVLNRETANALLAYAKAINRRHRSAGADLTVLSQTVVFKQDESFTLDFADDHVYPELSTPLWKRLAAEVVTTATQPDPKIRSTALKIIGSATFNEGKIELQAAIEESRDRPDLPSKSLDRRRTGMQMSVGLSEGDVCVLSNTAYFTGSDMKESRGRLVLLSARRYGNTLN
jgi:type II secretory pathway component GspD/PulD (secretin)